MLGFVRYQKDSAALTDFVKSNEAIFREVSTETVRAISVLGNIKELDSYFNSDRGAGEEAVDMCQALQDMIMEGEAKGEAKGKAESVLELLGDLGEIPETLRLRMMEEKDLEVLRGWLKLAAKAGSVDDFMNRVS